MNTNKEINIKEGQSPYGKLPLGAFLGNLFQVKKHPLADDPRNLKKNAENILELISVYGTSSIEINSIKEVERVKDVKQVMLNDNPELIFPKEKVFGIDITDTIESDKTIIGDESLAINACLCVNRQNHANLNDLINILMEAENGLKTTISRQEKRYDELTNTSY